MSSAHESGYRNEIQCGNVEDHLTFFTRVRSLLYLDSLLATKMQFFRITYLRFDSVRSATWLPVASNLASFTKEKYKNGICGSPDIQSVLEENRLTIRKLVAVLAKKLVSKL